MMQWSNQKAIFAHNRIPLEATIRSTKATNTKGFVYKLNIKGWEFCFHYLSLFVHAIKGSSRSKVKHLCFRKIPPGILYELVLWWVIVKVLSIFAFCGDWIGQWPLSMCNNAIRTRKMQIEWLTDGETNIFWREENLVFNTTSAT